MRGLWPSPRKEKRLRDRRPLKYIVGGSGHAVESNGVLEEGKLKEDNSDKSDKSEKWFGTDGVVTKTAELVPGISDIMRFVHQKNGEEEAAERARGNSLEKHLGKDGALTKALELLPGSNIIAAAVHEANGDHEEAKRSLNLIRNWREAGNPDGAITKLAEMLPGTDLIAFGVHAAHGNYAEALRSIMKTRYLVIDTERVDLFVDLRLVMELTLLKLQMKSDVRVHPVAGPVMGGLMDLAMSALHSGCETSRLDVQALTGDLPACIIQLGNASIHHALAHQDHSFGENIHHAFDHLPKVLEHCRTSMLNKCIVPSELPAPRMEDITVIQQALRKAAVVHGELPDLRQHRPRYGKYNRGLPEAAGAVSCLSFLGCVGCGWHTCVLGCLTGCAAGAAQAVRWVSANFVPMVNERNADSWKDLQTPAQHGRRLMSRDFDKHQADERPQGIVIDVPDISEVQDALFGYALEQMLPCWRFGRFAKRVLLACAPAVRAFLADLLLSRSPQVQFVYVMHTPAMGLIDGLELPAMPLGFILDLRLGKGEQLVKRVRVVMADVVVDQTMDRMSAQIPQMDLRQHAQQLKGFVKPINLQVKLRVEWPTRSHLSVVAENVATTLTLPS